ncbi:MAG: polyprenyl synthetase family protein [Lewinellaceae bacterium]|nr:polyprenyl synthetase family protein [Saprospiraceae bacterium]MCB9331534.1 polyprenyl synthetase family protein [Lewinellaceae bacterium]
MHDLPALLKKIDNYGVANPFPEAPRALYEPCSYILNLGGKRLRPALLLMATELFTDSIDRALPAAWAVELFHNFSLMHDDIMDAAPLRRGQPTVHTRWNTTTGILSGDVMLIHAYRHLASFQDAAVVAELVKVFNRVAIEVCEGQQYDINFETRNDVTLPEYIRMIELKTAVLLGGAMEMGAICAGASTADAEHLYHFGRLAGIAFQIQDDLLDTYGDPAKFGKQVGGDILQNKKTFLVLKALEIMPAENRSALETWLQTGPEAPGKVEAVRSIFDQNRIPELANAEKKQFQTEAFNHLEQVGVPVTRKAALRELITTLLDRDR